MIQDVGSAYKFGLWEHTKGGRYGLISFCVIEKGCIPAVLYVSLKDGSTWVRPCTEFFDGRFKKI